MQTSKIRIRLKSFDHRLLDQSAMEIVDTAKRTGAKISGPIPLPTEISRFTVNRDQNIDKKSREQFDILVNKRLLDFLDPSIQRLDDLLIMDLPAGVHVDIKTP